MKKPTLRFRQVFEHPTHFKVTRPLGNPIKIAKQGLSPNLMGRLRKFAEGGETPEPTQQDILNLEDLVASRALDVEPPPQFDARPPQETRPLRTAEEVQQSIDYIKNLGLGPEGTPVDVIRHGQVAQTPIETLPVVVPERVSAQPIVTEAPRISAGSLMGPPAPVAPVMQSDVAKPKLDTVSDLQQMLAEEKAKPNPDADMVAQLEGALSEQGKPAATPVATTTIAAPVASRQAGMVGKPAAPVAAALAQTTSELVLPKEFDVGKPLTVEAYRAAKEANKGRSDQEIALGLIRQYAPNAEPPPDFDKLLTPPPEGASEDTLKKFDAAKDDLARAIVNQAKVDYDTNKQLLVANERAQAQRLINAEKDRATADALVARRDALAKAVEGGFKPESLYGGNLAAQIGSALSIAAGAFASGMTGMPNFALKIYESAVDRDLEVQKAKYNSLVNQYNRLLGDADDAEKLARADLNDLAALQVEGIKASSKMRGVAPAADQMIADLRAKATKEREEVALKQAQAREAEVKAQLAEPLAKSLVNKRNAAGARAAAANNLAALRAGQAERRLNLAELRDQFKRDTQANAIKFSVPDPVDPSNMISVNAPSVTEANKARSKILNRVTALQRVEQLSDFMNKPRMIGDKIDPKFIKDVQVRLASVIENYPGLSKGTEQMVTQAQAMLLKDSASDIPLPAVRWADVLGLTSRAVDYLRKDGADGLANAVAMHARQGDPGREEFKRKFGPEGYGGKTALVEPAAAPSVPAGYTALRNPQSGKVQAVPNDKAKAAMAAGWTVP